MTPLITSEPRLLVLLSRVSSGQVHRVRPWSCALAGSQVGKRFCRQLALNAQCRVVAPEETQTEWFAFLNVLFMPFFGFLVIPAA